MYQFKDSVNITIISGKGGDGAISFRREKYIPKGGPDGGDGGRGGHVIFKVREDLRTLSFYQNRQIFKAKNGEPGGGSRRQGSDGADLILFVPPNTKILKEDGELISTLLEGEFLALKGGGGGRGNFHFRSSVNQTPRYAGKGREGEALNISLELSLIADIGLLGFPNVGKSSLITRLTNSKSKVAPYPFTTKVPHLGVLKKSYYSLIIADIPGIIQGAAQGAGLGLSFLRHIEKTKILAFLIDLSSNNFLDDFDLLKEELSNYSQNLLDKKRIVIANKLDLREDNFEKLKKHLKGESVFPLSIYSSIGLKEVEDEFFKLALEDFK